MSVSWRNEYKRKYPIDEEPMTAGEIGAALIGVTIFFGGAYVLSHIIVYFGRLLGRC
jgi:hypothetical protein